MHSLKSFAREALTAVMLAALFGCGPNDGEKELTEGWSAFDVRDFRKADRLFDKAVRLSGGSVDALMASARSKLELGELPSARAACDRAASAAPDDADVVLLGAELSYHEKNYAAARKAYAAFAADLSRTNSLRAQAFAALGVVELTQNDNDRARIALLKAIRLDRRNAAARYHLGHVYRNLGYDEAALEQFEIYVRLSQVANQRMQSVQRIVIPDIKDVIARKAADRPGMDRRNSAASAAALARADAAWKKNNFKAAREAYSESLKADPLSYPAAIGLARAVDRMAVTAADRAKAFDCYQCACALRPGASAAFVRAGALAFGLGRTETAAVAYSRALAADPTSVEILDGLIKSLRKLGGKSARLADDYQSYRSMLGSKRSK